MNSQSTTRTKSAPTLLGAAGEGDADALARLLASGSPADERAAPGGETPLMRAAARGHEEAVRVLLDAGADACARRADGFTPLILAVFFGHEGVARLLVERGADASARTGLGTTAARWAEARGFASIADLVRAAEASRPPAVVDDAAESVEAGGAKRLTATSSDEVEIFTKGRPRGGEGGEEAAEWPTATARAAEEDRRLPNVPAAGVSVRRDGSLPAHPSASAFRVGDFLRSWQGSLGALMLLLAFGVAVFALVQRGSAPGGDAQLAPAAPAPQAAAQQAPAPTLPTPEPSPAFPTPDALGVVPVPEQGYPVPDAAGRPFYVSPGPVAPVPSDVPRDLTVVSESGGAPANDAGQAGRRTGANDSPAPPRAGARNDNASEAAPRATRTPEAEPLRPAVPAPSPNQPPPPAPQPTPRAKVIQWPPQ